MRESKPESNVEKTRKRIGANRLSKEDRQEIMKKFISAGGKVEDDLPARKKRAAISRKRQAPAHNRNEPPLPANLPSNTAREEFYIRLQQDGDRDFQREEEKKETATLLAQIKLTYRRLFSRVVGFNGIIKPPFLSQINRDMRHILISLHIFRNQLFAADPAAAAQIGQALDQENPLYVELIERAAQLYEVEEWGLLGRTGSTALSVKEAYPVILSLLQKLHYMHAYRETYIKAVSRALEIAGQIKREGKSPLLIRRRQLVSGWKRLMDRFYRQFVLLFQVASGKLVEPGTLLFNELLGIEGQGWPGKRIAGDPLPDPSLEEQEAKEASAAMQQSNQADKQPGQSSQSDQSDQPGQPSQSDQIEKSAEAREKREQSKDQAGSPGSDREGGNIEERGSAEKGSGPSAAAVSNVGNVRNIPEGSHGGHGGHGRQGGQDRGGGSLAEQMKNPLRRELEYGHRLINSSTVGALRKRFDPRNKFLWASDKDKALISYLLICQFDKRYAALLTSPQIKFNVVYSGGARKNPRERIYDTCASISKIDISFKQYMREMQDFSDLSSQKQRAADYIRYSQSLSLVSSHRSTTSRKIRQLIGKYIQSMLAELAVLLKDIEEECKILRNPEEIVSLKLRSDQRANLQGKMVKEVIKDAYCFCYAFLSRLTAGNLYGAAPEMDEEEFQKLSQQSGGGADSASP